MTPPFETSPALSALPGILHGFFGRRGGVSGGDFHSLNMSSRMGDDEGLVAHNRNLALDAVGLGGRRLVILTQTHSAEIVTLDTVPPGAALPEGDGLVTTGDAVLGILTADCTPVLLADREAGIIGACHAGWKGAVTGIIGNTVAAMVARGARPDRIVAAIGPAITLANYEVGPDFAASLLRDHPEAAGQIRVPPGREREHFDLRGFCASRLMAAGIGHVETIGACTYEHADRYFSHRRATHQAAGTGRQLALIALA